MVACFLLTACAGEAVSVSSSTPSPPSEPVASSTARANSGGRPAEDLPIDMETVTYDDTLEDVVEYRHGDYVFELPRDWEVVDGADQGLLNGLFLLPPGADKSDFRFSAHVGLELYDGSSLYPEGAPDFSDPEVQESFFAYQTISVYSKMSGLSDLEFMVWESAQGMVYIEQFKRSNDTLTMYQTTYHLMHPERDVAVNAAHFGEDATPGVEEVARHAVNTFHEA